MTVTSKPSLAPPGTARTRTLEKRDSLWPDAPQEVWSAKGSKGYTPIPRMLGPSLAVIDSIRKAKESAGSGYFVLWCHEFGEGFIQVDDPAAFAFEAGYTQTAERGARSWGERISVLEELGFVRTLQNGLRKQGYVLLRDPHRVLAELRVRGLIGDTMWNVILGRGADIGVKMLDHLAKAEAAAVKS